MSESASVANAVDQKLAKTWDSNTSEKQGRGQQVLAYNSIPAHFVQLAGKLSSKPQFY